MSELRGEYRPYTRFERFMFTFVYCGARAVADDMFGDWDDYRCERYPLHFGRHSGWGRRKEWRRYKWSVKTGGCFD